MNFYLIVITCSCFFLPVDSTLGPGSRKSSSRSTDKVAPTVSPTIQSKPSSSPLPPHVSSPAKTSVLQRNLLEETITPKSILEHHQSYCSACLDTREFTHPTLVYITPWNSHGYDVAKLFTKKFDYISPVWLSIKRIGLEKYAIEGTHDIDRQWLDAVRDKHPQIRIVPRVIFDNWPVDHVHALFQSENEKQQLAKTFAEFLIEHNQLFDGYVLELLMQFRGASKPTINHIINDIAEHVHQIESNRTKKEIILAVPPYDELFDKKDFELLYEHLDGFSVMTYDFPNREPGPVAPLEWVKMTMEKFSMPEGESPAKVFLGLNFYGYRYDRVASSASSKKGEQQPQYEMKPIIGRDYVEFLRQHHSTSMIVYDSRVHEHITVIQMRSTKPQPNALPETIIFYPSLKSIYERLELATKLNLGVAIWDGGQGFFVLIRMIRINYYWFLLLSAAQRFALFFFGLKEIIFLLAVHKVSMVGQFIDTFWRKSFIGDLRRARKVANEDILWTLIYAGKAHQFQFVWIQGICIKIDKNADSMVVEDATGQAEVQNCSRVPEVWSIKEGDYTMVAGKCLQTTSSDRIIVDAYRIQCLQNTSKSEISWPFEVVDISQHVYHNQM